MSLGQLTSSALLYCPDEPTPTATTTPCPTFTIWLFPAWAACPTSDWPGEYTITEVCTGDPATWTQPAIPPNFIKTVVTCDVCEQKTQTITCPVDEAIQTGDVKINGNDITATPPSVLALATDAPDSGAGPGPGSDIAPGAGSGPGSSSPAPAPGAAPGGSPGPDAGAGGDSPAAAPLPAPNNNAGPGSAPDSGSGSSPAPDSGSGPDAGAAPAPGGGYAGGSSPTLVTPQSDAGTDAASSPYASAGAPTLKCALLLFSGMFALVSGSIICY